MRTVRLFLGGTSLRANNIFLTALLTLIIKAIFLDDIPAPYPYFYKIGVISNEIISSIVAGYIFYIVFNYTDLFKDRNNLRSYIEVNAERIKVDCRFLVEELSRFSGSSFTIESVTLENLEGALTLASAINNPNVKTVDGTIATWFGLFELTRKRNAEWSGNILRLSRLLNSEFERDIIEIADCTFFAMVSEPEFFSSSQNYLMLAGPAFEYCERCKNIAKLA